MDINKSEVGQRIKTIRLSKGKNLREFGELISKELAEQNKISDSIVSRWEKGVSIPNAKRLKQIAELGNITTNELLYGVDFSYDYIENNITTEKMKKEITQNLLSFLKNYLFYSEYNYFAEKTSYLLDLFISDLGFDIETLLDKVYRLISNKKFSFYQHGVFVLLNEDFTKLHIQLYLTEYIYNLLVQISLEYPDIYYKNLLLQIDETKVNIQDISRKKDVYKDDKQEFHLTEFIDPKAYFKIFDELDKLKEQIESKNIIKSDYKE